MPQIVNIARHVVGGNIGPLENGDRIAAELQNTWFDCQVTIKITRPGDPYILEVAFQRLKKNTRVLFDRAGISGIMSGHYRKQ